MAVWRSVLPVVVQMMERTFIRNKFRGGVGKRDAALVAAGLFEPVLLVRGLAALILVGVAVACSAPRQTPVAETPQPSGLERIPAPDPAKYPPMSKMSGWQNPYLVVRDDGIGIVDLSNHEIHMLKPEEIPAELVSLPSSAWPYGRVVLVAEAAPKDATELSKINLRKNRALLLGTLKELSVEFREAP